MAQPRLNDIMILHVHKDRADDLNLREIADEFVAANESRRRYFGCIE
jgi:hypothetical protein